MSSLLGCGLTVLATACAAGLPEPAAADVGVGIGEQDPTVFATPAFQALDVQRTRYVVPADVLRRPAELQRASVFAQTARESGVSVLLHISTADIRPLTGRRVATVAYRRDVERLVAHFRRLGVREFGAWNSANHKSQETWDSPGHAASYFKSLYRAVKFGTGGGTHCRTCVVVGLDLLDQRGAEDYAHAVFSRLSSLWRARLSIVGIHAYSDVNRFRSARTGAIIRSVRQLNRGVRFWLTETGAVAQSGPSIPYDEARQARRIGRVFSIARRYETSGLRRFYLPSFFAVAAPCHRPQGCELDAGIIRGDGTPRVAYATFKQRLERARSSD